jgi:pimeloyl-ACP methyl ester carboxylesterase
VAVPPTLAVVHDHGDGPAVVLLHGQPGTSADWVGVAERLPSNVRVVVPDRPGYGRTGGRAAGFAANAAAVVALLDRLGIETAHVVGYSWSGAVALALARDDPGRLSGITLVASVRPGTQLGLLDRALAVPVFGMAMSAGAIGVTGLLLQIPRVRHAVDRRFGGSTEAGLNALDQALAGGRAGVSFFHEQQALIHELGSLVAGLTEIAVPVTVVYGTNDRIVPPAEGALLARAISGAREVAVDGAGHLLPHERPEVVASVVLDALGLRCREGGPAAEPPDGL